MSENNQENSNKNDSLFGKFFDWLITPDIPESKEECRKREEAEREELERKRLDALPLPPTKEEFIRNEFVEFFDLEKEKGITKYAIKNGILEFEWSQCAGICYAYGLTRYTKKYGIHKSDYLEDGAFLGFKDGYIKRYNDNIYQSPVMIKFTADYYSNGRHTAKFQGTVLKNGFWTNKDLMIRMNVKFPAMCDAAVKHNLSHEDRNLAVIDDIELYAKDVADDDYREIKELIGNEFRAVVFTDLNAGETREERRKKAEAMQEEHYLRYFNVLFPRDPFQSIKMPDDFRERADHKTSVLLEQYYGLGEYYEPVPVTILSDMYMKSEEFIEKDIKDHLEYNRNKCQKELLGKDTGIRTWQ